jgi:8-oxo-dGTP pyrophosphatase MutT (NUDIX family)
MTASPPDGKRPGGAHGREHPAPPSPAAVIIVVGGALAGRRGGSETSESEHEPAEPRTRQEHAACDPPSPPVHGPPVVTRRVPRASARVLVVGPDDTLLLLQFRSHGRNPGSLYWLTPGGGIGPGESVAEAAIRELREETGIRVPAAGLGPVVAYSAGEWTSGSTVFDAHDSYFLVRTAATTVDTSAQEDLERSLITGHRWWALDDLDRTADRIVPPNAGGLVRALLADGPPAAPIELPWR